MAEYQTKSKKETSVKKVEKVVSNKPIVRKKKEISKFKEMFISDDAKNVKSYIFLDVLIPAAKKALSDIVKDGVDMILYGETGRRNKNSITGKISYRDFYKKDDDYKRDVSYRGSKTSYYFDDVIFQTRKDAEEVLSSMDDIIEDYGFVTVADYYELSEVRDDDRRVVLTYTYNDYGWKDLHDVKVRPVREGYILTLPKAIPNK